jgi:hypothetical protein
MNRFRTLFGSCAVVVAAFGVGVIGCHSYEPVPVVTANAYETCDDRVDTCPSGLTCTPSTLPASAGFTGEFCSSGCSFSTDCLQLVSNYDAICVNDLCYIQCPDGGAACPYGTGCATFSDQDGNAVNLCTP